MATKGSHLSTRMSSEAQNSVKTNAGMLFKRYKVDISNAIKTSFPFLEILRDYGYITDKKYKESREHFEKNISIQEVIYNILSDLEKTFDLPLLGILFSKSIMKNYPDLNYIYKIFENEIPNIKNFLESDAEENEGRSDIQLSLKQESMDLRKPPTSGNIHCKRGSKKHKEEYVDLHTEILPMTCGEMKGMSYKNKLEEGSMVKCIKTEDGRWFTPQEFEAAGGYKSSSNWKNTVRCGGITLKRLMEEEKLPTPLRKYSKKKNLEKPGVCEICRDGENLLHCDTCSRFFHGDCHLPPVQTERPLRRPWSCTFCRVKESPGTLQCHKESEVLARWMGPEEQLKCEFLLLEIYCHSDNDCSEKMSHDNYTPEIFECMKNLQMLKEIGKKLREQCYPNVEGFMRDMRLIFQNHRAFNKCKDLFLLGITLEKKFEKNFTEVFAIREIKQEHTDKQN
ncbi:nuclear body protein SP140-like protein isoform X7 [Sturnira hondurensis]|uniref:nuclear body protein SP140-like protein isoform X7 n=1 Tax=Sturnira hondurensis TaxID=192404 RepID=UPI00187A1BDA|nr:nuclear body protein SP140-like protein isoform X7 [Sturnira hondurensis]